MHRSTLVTALALALVVGATAPGWGDPITVTLSIEASGGSWHVYATTSTNCDGLASFIIDVEGISGDVAVTRSLMKAPKGYDGGWGAMFGFATLSSHGSAGIGICSSQETNYLAPNDPEKDALVLVDVGIAADSHLDVSWDAPVLLASGTYSGTTGELRVDVGNGFFNVLNSGWTGPGHVSIADVVLAGTCVLEEASVIPEPATSGLVATGLCLAGACRRRLAIRRGRR